MEPAPNLEEMHVIFSSILEEARRLFTAVDHAEDFNWRINAGVLEFGRTNTVTWTPTVGFAAVPTKCTPKFLRLWSRQFEPHVDLDPEVAFGNLVKRSEAFNELAELVLTKNKFRYVITTGGKVWARVKDAKGTFLHFGARKLTTVSNMDVAMWTARTKARSHYKYLISQGKIAEKDWGVVRVPAHMAVTISLSEIDWNNGVGVGSYTTPLIPDKTQHLIGG